MNAFARVFSPGRSGTLLGFSVALAILTWLRWPEAAPVAPDSPGSGRQSDLRAIGAASRGIPLVNPVQEDGRRKSAETDSVDEWIRVSPRRAHLMSTEAMAGYEPIFAALDLSPSQLRRLKQLIVERAESASDADQLGKENRLSPAQTLFVRNEAEASFNSELEQVVGPENFPVVREMMQLAPQLADIADSIGRELARTDSPLDADQMLQLARLYKIAYARNPATGPAVRSPDFDPKTELDYVDRKILVRASGLLKPEQLDVLRRGFAVTSTSNAAQP